LGLFVAAAALAPEHTVAQPVRAAGMPAPEARREQVEAPRGGLDLALSLVEPELFVHVPVIGRGLLREVVAPRPPPKKRGAPFDFAAALTEEEARKGAPDAHTLREVLRCEATMTDAPYGERAAFEHVCGLALEPTLVPGAFVWRRSSATVETVVIAIAGTSAPKDLVADAAGLVLTDMGSLPDDARAPHTTERGGDAGLRVGLGWAARWGETGGRWWRERGERARAAAATSHKHLDVVLLGHSLGAAAAQLGAWLTYRHLRERERETGASFHVRVTTFGSPALGDEAARDAYQRALVEGCGGRVCFSLHQFENRADLVHDLPGAGFFHPVWQTDNTSRTIGAGALGHLTGGDKSMYYADPRTALATTPLTQLMGYHLMRSWHDEVDRISDEVLTAMGYL